jgi:carboxyl-terminal processing protease
MRALVLDLRENTGGLLDSAIKVADPFLNGARIAALRPRAGQEFVYDSTANKKDESGIGYPMACLVNGATASGSEIVAACLQDHKRGFVVGERTFGKTSVQTTMDFDGGKIYLSTSMFWRPSGKDLNRTPGSDDWGIAPDKAVPLSRKELSELREHFHQTEVIPRRNRPVKDARPPFKDRQLEDALAYLREQFR